MLFGNYRKSRRRKASFRKLNRELKQQETDIDMDISTIMQETLSALQERTDEDFSSYLKYLRDGSLLFAKVGIKPAGMLYGRTSRLIALTQTPKRFYQFLEKASDLVKRLPRDYKEPSNPLAMALAHIPEEVKTTSQFEDYLKHYERYFRIIAEHGDQTKLINLFYELRKDANTLEEICSGTDCLEIAVDAGIYNYDCINHRLPNYCVRAARRPSFEKYKQSFSNVAANLDKKFSLEILSYGAPVVALFANTKDEIKTAFSKLQEFWNRVGGVIPGGGVMELVSVVSDYQEYTACLDALASLWESCKKIALNYHPLMGGWFEEGQIREAEQKIMNEHYPKIVAMSKTADQFLDYINAYIKFYEKACSKPEYKETSSFYGPTAASFVDKLIFDQLPEITQALDTHGDFDVSITLRKGKQTVAGDYGIGESDFEVDCISGAEIKIEPVS